MSLFLVLCVSKESGRRLSVDTMSLAGDVLMFYIADGKDKMLGNVRYGV